MISFPTQKLNNDSTRVLAQMEQIRLSLKKGNNIKNYAKPEIHWLEMQYFRNNPNKIQIEKAKKEKLIKEIEKLIQK